METTFVREAGCETKAETRVWDSIHSWFNAFTDVLAVSWGLSLTIESLHPIAASIWKWSSVWYIGNTWHQVIHHVAARHCCFGGLGCTHHHHAHKHDQGSQLENSGTSHDNSVYNTYKQLVRNLFEQSWALLHSQSWCLYREVEEGSG